MKKKNLDKGDEENRHSERITAPRMGFVLKKKEESFRQAGREKKIISKNSVFAPGCSTERDSEIHTAPRPPCVELVS